MTIPSVEDTLDPKTPEEWEELRAIGHRMVDDVIALHRGIRDRPAWRPVAEESKAALAGALPSEGCDVGAAVEAVDQHVLPFYLGNIHPRSWGWVNGTGTTLGAFGDLIAAGMNPNCAGAEQGALHVELQVLETLKAAFGWPAEGSGVLTSGGSVANLIGVAVARDWALREVDVGTRGLRSASAQLVAYTSVAAHNSVDRAIRLLGIGTDHLRKIPKDAAGRMDVAALTTAIESDRAAGLLPFCVVATAGTVDQGSVDPLDTLADLCRKEDLWLHVDGAFGAIAALSEELRPLVRGMERADSLAFDLHKWLHVPVEAGCILVRDAESHRRPFSAPASYLQPLGRGMTPAGWWLSNYGPQLTRGFRALKSWLTLKVYGTERLGRLALQNVRQTRHLERLVRDHPRLEVLAAGALNVLCFRYRSDAVAEADLDAFNKELLADLQESGVSTISSTVVDGRFALRLAIANHRTRHEDLQIFVDAVVDLGDRQSSPRS